VTNDFAGFHGPDDIALGAAIIGLATIVLVGFQSVLASRQISISLRQTDIAEEQTRIAKTQTEILIKQDEILNRTEKLTFHVFQDGAFSDTIRYQAPQEGAAAAFDIFFAVRNEGLASCNRIYVSVFIPTSNQMALSSSGTDSWTEGPPVTESFPSGAIELSKYETQISVDVFAGRSIWRAARLSLAPPIPAGLKIYWRLQSEHGSWPGPGPNNNGQLNVEAVTEP
jgi:hypothetical protein